MSDSATVSSLQQLLARPAPRSPPRAAGSINSSASRCRTPSPSSRSAKATTAPPARTPPTRAGWGATISSAFGYRPAPSASSSPAPAAEALSSATFGAGGQRARTRERGRIPAWTTVPEVHLVDAGAAGDEPAVLEEDEDNELDSLAETIVWQAGNDGVDPPGPLLVFAGSRIPPPSEVSHANLLANLRRRLERFAQSGPYTVVLLVNPTPHAPTTAHLVSSYLSVARVVRKNVRHIYIVGGGWWTRAILGIFSSTLLSVKSAEKLVQCATLSGLAQAVGPEAFKQIEFPLEVYVANAATEDEIVVPVNQDESLKATFGRPLEQTMSENENDPRLPTIVRDCVDVLLDQGRASVGIFRRSPSAAHVMHLRGAYERGHPVSLSTLPDAPYLAASLLKLYLRELPVPLLPGGDVWDVARTCPVGDDDAALAHVEVELVPLLSSPTRTLLRHVLGVLALIAANSKDNLMTASNLVVCLCPALIGGLGEVPTMEEIEMCRVPGANGMATIRGVEGTVSGRGNTVGGVLKVMIERYSDLFPPSRHAGLEPAQHRPATPPRPTSSTSSSSPSFDGQPRVQASTSSPASSSTRSMSPASLAAPTRPSSSSSTPSRRLGHNTIKLKKPARAGAKCGAGILVEAFREEDDEERDVQRLEAHGELVSPGQSAAAVRSEGAESSGHGPEEL